ncbi:MAG: hypothetical protein PVG03_04325 [Desulfarculaceae bacterium]|jgi:hypothetical protein
MKLKGHLVASIPLGVAWYLGGGGLAPALGAAAASVLIDVDHLPDYLWWRRARASLSDFFHTNHHNLVPTLMLPLHAWEWIPLGFVLFWFLAGPIWAWALTAAWAYHLSWDQYHNQVNGWFYFFCYRAKFGFSRSKLIPYSSIMEPKKGS